MGFGGVLVGYEFLGIKPSDLRMWQLLKRVLLHVQSWRVGHMLESLASSSHSSHRNTHLHEIRVPLALLDDVSVGLWDPQKNEEHQELHEPFLTEEHGEGRSSVSSDASALRDARLVLLHLFFKLFEFFEVNLTTTNINISDFNTQWLN